MEIETGGIPGPLVAAYDAIPIAFEVTSVLTADRRGDGSFVLGEHTIATPYVKDYDAISERPREWADRFDTSQWTLLLAWSGREYIGAATVAFRTPGLEMLEGRRDLALLWDIRVAPAFRGRGVGRALFEAAASSARGQGCRELKVETQNVNVAACRFYAAMGCELRAVDARAYPQHPDESQFLWYKPLENGSRT